MCQKQSKTTVRHISAAEALSLLLPSFVRDWQPTI